MLKKYFPDREKTVIINATNIGYKFNGICVYSLKLLEEFKNLQTEISFLVYLNRNAAAHININDFPGNFNFRWVSSVISPDYKFKGHLLRLLFSNLLSFLYMRYLRFNTSQLELNLFQARQIVTVHDIIPLLFPSHHRKQYIFYKLFISPALRKADFILTPSLHSKKLLQDTYRIPDERIRVIYNGANTTCSIKKFNDPLFLNEYILYIGRICNMKNIPGLLKAFDLISSDIHHNLVILGDNKKMLDRYMLSCRLAESVRRRIIYRENLEEKEKSYLIKKASLLVFPSFYEGFGLPPIEAMACGCPVVVSANSSLTEVCGNAAVYINPFDEKDIGNGMLKVLQDQKLREGLIAKGYQKSAGFTWSVSAAAHLSVLEEILKNQKFPTHNFAEEFNQSVDANLRFTASGVSSSFMSR